MRFYYNNKSISKSEAEKLAGSRFAAIVADAKEAYADDPNTALEYMIAGGQLAIEFA